jgi:hypothetical protein
VVGRRVVLRSDIVGLGGILVVDCCVVFGVEDGMFARSSIVLRPASAEVHLKRRRSRRPSLVIRSLHTVPAFA